MGLFSQLVGTFSSLFQLGGTSGPQLSAVSTTEIAARNPTNTAYINASGLDPVNSYNFATKNYVDSSQGLTPNTLETGATTTVANDDNFLLFHHLALRGTRHVALRGRACMGIIH